MKKLYKVMQGAAALLFISSQLSAQAPLQKFPSWSLGPFVRPEGKNPVIKPDTSSVFNDPMQKKVAHWEPSDTFNPAATVYNGKIYVLYRAEDHSGEGIGQRTSRLGLASTTDGVTMKKSPVPVLYPGEDSQKEFEWRGGCEDPRVAVTADGTYLILYTQWNSKVPRLASATSKDLVHWKKAGPVFQDAYNGKFFNLATKSASIVTSLIKGKQVITKVNGKYFMYWGEENVYAATSTNLVDWAPLINEDGTLQKLASPREGLFDSQLTECGPPAVLTDRGIVLMYNGKNNAKGGDPNYTANSYSAGQILFSKTDPTKILYRLDKPFLMPEASFEKSGQYPAGTVFIEGLAYYKSKWYLYYGCADSRVAVAIYDPAKRAK